VPTQATDRIMVDRITADLIMEVIRAPSRSRLAIGLTTFVALVITWATPITSGGQDIGDGGMVSESGSTAITSCVDTDPAVTAQRSTLKR
jgi:hypothetical protein